MVMERRKVMWWTGVVGVVTDGGGAVISRRRRRRKLCDGDGADDGGDVDIGGRWQHRQWRAVLQWQLG